MTLVTRSQTAMVIVNLCAPGVRVRATKFAERKKTPEQWAQSIGAQAAINADFFDLPGWSYVNGRARGDGEDWPNMFHESRAYWVFGLFVADLVQNASIPPPAPPFGLDIVGGHNILIRDGQSQGPGFDGDLVITTSHRRTAVGISQDKRTLYLFATDKILNGTGLTNELISHAAEAGAPPIWFATNMDGGGSSQLYVQGHGQIITSGRLVNNHLGIFASGSGPAGNCNNIAPRGSLDSATCDGIGGWAQDPNAPDAPIDVHLYYGGPVGTAAPGKSYRAGNHRNDLCTAIGSCNHGFHVEPPQSYFDGAPHPIHAYGIDTGGGHNPEIGGSPKNLQCRPPLPSGKKRHIIGPGSYTDWAFDAFWDSRPITDAELGAFPLSDPWPAKPDLIRGPGSNAIYFVDHGFRRHIPNPDVAARWRIDLSKTRDISAADMAQYQTGPVLRSRPTLVQGTGPAIYLVDDGLPAAPPPPPPPPPPDSGADAGTTDAGAPTDFDAGTLSPTDAGEIPTHDGGNAIDAGTLPTDDVAGSCGCTSVEGAVLLWTALVVPFRRRRQPSSATTSDKARADTSPSRR